MNSDLEWQRRYEENDTPWDKGGAAPSLLKFLEENAIAGHVLVPGCGRGHEARALAKSPHAAVVGLDISATAVAQAREVADNSMAPQPLTFIQGDFLDLPVPFRGSFDWLVEHTCFCALEPSQRRAYASSAAAALKRGGKIFGIFYLNPDTESGPPFAVSHEELEELFDSHFDLVNEWVPGESFPGREGRELVRVMQKR